jgi:hypothetical protein
MVKLIINLDGTVERVNEAGEVRRYQPRDEVVVRSALVKIECIHPGETFIYKGQHWRKLEGGVRKARGPAPKHLQTIEPSTLVVRG